MASTSFLLSRPIVIVLNAVVILTCILFAIGVLLPTSHLHIFAKLVCAIAPVLTILFFLPRSRSKALAAISIAANLIVLACTLIFLYRVANVSLTQSLVLLVATLFVLLFLIPALSMAAVAAHWPSRK
ncbi:hypothetical protein [Rudaea sp.]|uniref:hypothetical protein n=1 Tax=Rudaea sp. TaxID=2136325 RepID=UPI002ED35C8F